jgi:hypothetical protein
MLGSPFCVEDQNGNGLIVNVIGRWGPPLFCERVRKWRRFNELAFFEKSRVCKCFRSSGLERPYGSRNVRPSAETAATVGKDARRARVRQAREEDNIGDEFS